MSRPQFTLRSLLVLTLAVACCFGGIRFERERRRREDEAARAEILSGMRSKVMKASLPWEVHDDLMRWSP